MSTNCDFCGKPNTITGPLVNNGPGNVHICYPCTFMVVATHVVNTSTPIEKVSELVVSECKKIHDRVEQAAEKEPKPEEAEV
jgi:hypothetical protein